MESRDQGQEQDGGYWIENEFVFLRFVWIEIDGLPFLIIFWIEIDGLSFSDFCWQYRTEKLVDGEWMDGCSLWSMGANPCMYDVCMLRNQNDPIGNETLFEI